MGFLVCFGCGLASGALLLAGAVAWMDRRWVSIGRDLWGW